MTTDRVFVLLMMVLLMMAGCFEATSTTEAQEEQDSTSGGDGNDVTDSETTSNQNSNSDNNHAPVISAEIISYPMFYNGADCTTEGIEFEVRHAMMDWDGTIISAGWDVNLDGQIDYPVSTNEGYTEIQMVFDYMIENILISTSSSGNNQDTHYYERSIVFGALDDDGQWTSSELFEISRLVGYTQDNEFIPYTGFDIEQCDDFEDLTDYEFSIIDHADYISPSGHDYIINISRTNGQSGFDIDRMKIVIANQQYGNTTVTSIIGNSANHPCMIVMGNQCEIIINSNDTLFDTDEIVQIYLNGYGSIDENEIYSVFIFIDGTEVYYSEVLIR